MSSPGDIARLPAGVAFEGSYVLSITVAPYFLAMDVDFLLAPTHALYRRPVPGEHGCFRTGRLLIADFGHIAWKASGLVPAIDATGELDFGTLDELAWVDQRWRLTGDWGVIEVSGGTLSIDFVKQP